MNTREREKRDSERKDSTNTWMDVVQEREREKRDSGHKDSTNTWMDIVQERERTNTSMVLRRDVGREGEIL